MNPIQYEFARGKAWLSDFFYLLSVRLGHNDRLVRASAEVHLPRSRVLKASFHFSLAGRASQAEIEEWLTFSLGGGSMDGSNPLDGEDIDVIGQVILQDTGAHQHLEVEGTHARFTIRKELRTTPYTGPTMSDLVCNPNHPAFGPRDEA